MHLLPGKIFKRSGFIFFRRYLCPWKETICFILENLEILKHPTLKKLQGNPSDFILREKITRLTPFFFFNDWFYRLGFGLFNSKNLYYLNFKNQCSSNLCSEPVFSWTILLKSPNFANTILLYAHFHDLLFTISSKFKVYSVRAFW